MSTRNLVGLFYFWKMLCDKVYPLNYAGMGNLLMFVKVAGSWLKYRPENHCRVLLPPEKNPQVYKCKCQQHTIQMQTTHKHKWKPVVLLNGKFPPQAIWTRGQKNGGKLPKQGLAAIQIQICQRTRLQIYVNSQKHANNKFSRIYIVHTQREHGTLGKFHLWTLTQIFLKGILVAEKGKSNQLWEHQNWVLLFVKVTQI